MILLIDNYDSFSYNLVQLIGEFQEEVKVLRNDETTVEEIRTLAPTHIVLSPGAGKPCDTKVCIDIVKELREEFPILGICLGHQTICEVLGMTVSYAKKLMHGKTSEITVKPQGIFKDLPEKVTVARYHSLSAVADTLTEDLEILATADDGEIMAVKVKNFPVYGLQFHPESILTPEGNVMMKNFLGGQ